MKNIIALSCILLILFSSCTAGEKPPTYTELQQQHHDSSADASQTEAETADPAEEEAARIREESAKAIAAILTDNRGVNFPTTFCGTSSAAACDGGIYIDCFGSICLLNRKTGYLQGLCNDPLCKHDSCIESYEIESMVSDGEKLYWKGYSVSYTEFSSNKWDKKSFIASYDPEKDKFEFLDVWEKDQGAVSINITLHNGYLYYTKKMDDQTNSLFRIPTTGGQRERLTYKDEFVQQWTVTANKIIYLTDSHTLKRMDHDGSNTEILDEYICMTYVNGNDLYKISVINENGYQVYCNSETLPIKVYSPVNTVLTDDTIWYTIPDEQILGTYTDAYGREKDIITYNGTAFYRYNLTTGERMEYDCPFIYGIAEFCGTIGKYMLVQGLTEERGYSWWIFNPEAPNEAYRLYEY